MRRKINNFISVLYTCVRLLIIKLCHGDNVKVNMVERISPNVVLEVNRGGKLELGKKVRIHSGSKIKIRKGANLIIEDNVKMNYNCMIFCHDSIKIGKECEFGPNVLVYDHDHIFDSNKGVLPDEFQTSPVEIGDNVWIGANTVILRGSKIGSNAVIAAGSIVTGSIPAGTVFIQKRTAKIK